MNRKRIAVYYNVGWGGGRRWLYECVSRLSAYHDVDLYSIDREPDAAHYPDVSEFAEHAHTIAFRDLPRKRGPLKVLRGAQMWQDLIRFDRASADIARRIDGGGYDLLFASVGGYTEAPLPLRHAKTRSAYYCHEPMRLLYEPAVPRPYGNGLAKKVWQRAFYGTLVKRWDRQGTRAADLVITNSRYCRDYTLRSYGVDSVVNYPGVDTNVFAPGNEPKETVVLTVGEQLPTKGFDWSIRAIGAIPKGRRPTLLWVGNRTQPDEERYLRSIAEAEGVHLDMRERVPDAELRRLFRTAAVFLYTPHLEPFGLAPVEAMASGTPVVAVREAGPIETIVDGVTGYLCERDPQALGDAVDRILSDRALSQRMGIAAREHVVANFTWDRSVTELAALLGSAAESGQAAVTPPVPVAVVN